MRNEERDARVARNKETNQQEDERQGAFCWEGPCWVVASPGIGSQHHYGVSGPSSRLSRPAADDMRSMHSRCSQRPGATASEQADGAVVQCSRLGMVAGGLMAGMAQA